MFDIILAIFTFTRAVAAVFNAMMFTVADDIVTGQKKSAPTWSGSLVQPFRFLAKSTTFFYLTAVVLGAKADLQARDVHAYGSKTYSLPSISGWTVLARATSLPVFCVFLKRQPVPQTRRREAISRSLVHIVQTAYEILSHLLYHHHNHRHILLMWYAQCIPQTGILSPPVVLLLRKPSGRSPTAEHARTL